MIVSFIKYPRQNNRMQVRLAIKGDFHREQLCYYVKDPKTWQERIWIIIPVEIVDELTAFLMRDPRKIENWM